MRQSSCPTCTVFSSAMSGFSSSRLRTVVRKRAAHAHPCHCTHSRTHFEGGVEGSANASEVQQGRMCPDEPGPDEPGP